MVIQYPSPLQRGARIGLIAPSGAVRMEGALDRAIAAVAKEGFTPVIGESCGKVYGYLSGPDDIRACDINAMFTDDTIDGIFCIRGGYGTPRLLEMLDYDAIRGNPKPFLGYSDITGLHAALLTHCALQTFHGPMPAYDWIHEEAYDPRTMQHMRRMLMSPIDGVIENFEGFPTQCITPGRAEGRLVGGNLTLLSGLCGTPWMPDVRGAIIFLEDIGEKTYRLDHMLAQLRSVGVFNQCAGVVLGQFTDCPVEHERFGLDLSAVVNDLIVPAGKPVLMGLQAGHCKPTLTLPLGAWCSMDAGAGLLDIRRI